MSPWIALALAAGAGYLYVNKKDEKVNTKKTPEASESPVTPLPVEIVSPPPAPPPTLQEKYQPVINEALAWNQFKMVSLFDKLNLSDIALVEYGDPRVWPIIADASLPITKIDNRLVLSEMKDYYTYGEGVQVRVPPAFILTDELAQIYRARAAAYVQGDLSTFRQVTLAF